MATNTTTFTDANFQEKVLNADQPVLVDFWAPWCGPCHMITPTIEALTSDFEGRATIGKLNVDENQRTAAQYGIRSIPTLLIFRNGEVVDQVVGVVPKDQLAQKLEAAIGQPA